MPRAPPTTIPEYYIPPAPPPPPPSIPSAQTAFDSASSPPTVQPTSSALSRPYSPSPPPPPANYVPSPSHPPSGAPPAAPPPPPPGAPVGHQLHQSPAHTGAQSSLDSGPTSRKTTMLGMIPMSDARSDLLAAIRRGLNHLWMFPDFHFLFCVACFLSTAGTWENVTCSLKVSLLFFFHYLSLLLYFSLSSFSSPQGSSWGRSRSRGSKRPSENQWVTMWRPSCLVVSQ